MLLLSVWTLEHHWFFFSFHWNTHLCKERFLKNSQIGQFIFNNQTSTVSTILQTKLCLLINSLLELYIPSQDFHSFSGTGRVYRKLWLRDSDPQQRVLTNSKKEKGLREMKTLCWRAERGCICTWELILFVSLYICTILFCLHLLLSSCMFVST